MENHQVLMFSLLVIQWLFRICKLFACIFLTFLIGTWNMDGHGSLNVWFKF